MYVLVTGASGQLGCDAVDLLKARGINVTGVCSKELDITDKVAVEAFFKAVNPTHVIHCAAYTAVDKAESERELCRKVNVDGTENIALCCKKSGAKMIYISTDYIFNGAGEADWDEESLTSPSNWYGQTKLNGENAVKNNLNEYFIVRTSWVFGKNGGNFVKTMLRLAKEKPEISVVSDQIGSPTYSRDLSVVLAEMLFIENYGTYNVTNAGICSWYDFACEIFRLKNIDVKVKPILSENYHTPAKRPFNSRLSKAKLKENNLPVPGDWHDALYRYLIEIDEITE